MLIACTFNQREKQERGSNKQLMLLFYRCNKEGVGWQHSWACHLKVRIQHPRRSFSVSCALEMWFARSSCCLSWVFNVVFVYMNFCVLFAQTLFAQIIGASVKRSSWTDEAPGC
jgi:hypothetical protein